jgi:hypothetical protein
MQNVGVDSIAKSVYTTKDRNSLSSPRPPNHRRRRGFLKFPEWRLIDCSSFLISDLRGLHIFFALSHSPCIPYIISLVHTFFNVRPTTPHGLFRSSSERRGLLSTASEDPNPQSRSESPGPGTIGDPTSGLPVTSSPILDGTKPQDARAQSPVGLE